MSLKVSLIGGGVRGIQFVNADEALEQMVQLITDQIMAAA